MATNTLPPGTKKTGARGDRTRRIVVALVLVLWLLAIASVTFFVATVPTGSMTPTIQVGDVVLVEQGAFGFDVPGIGEFPGYRTIEWGDVVVLSPPHSPELNYVKRVVGLPGDRLQMRDGVLYRNGTGLDEPYAHHTDEPDGRLRGMEWQRDHLAAGVLSEAYHPTRDNWGPLVLPDSSYFVLGDNRDGSDDSRFWGFAHRSDITGYPLAVLLGIRPDTSGTHWVRRIRWARHRWIN